MNTSGIYKITCLANNKIYIGSAANIHARFLRHLSRLKTGKHFNKHLQSAYNKYGRDNFSVEVVEQVKESDLLKREQIWIDNTKCCDPKIGFNLSNTAAPTDSKTFNRAKSYVVTDPNGVEYPVTNLEKFCRENKLEKSSLHKVANGELWQYKGWSCRKAEDSQWDWLKKRRRGRKSGPSSDTWRLTFRDGTIEEIFSLNKWAKENRYSLGSLRELMIGKRKRCKKVIKLEKIPSAL